MIDGDYDVPEGTPIPGSRYVRAYCPECKCAMRVKDIPTAAHCDECTLASDRLAREQGIKPDRTLKYTPEHRER